MTLPHHPAALQVQGRKPRRGSVASVVVGAPLDWAGPHRPQRLSAIQSLNLGLCIDAQDQGPIRRVQVQPHDLSYFFNKQRVSRQFESLAAVGLQGQGAPNPAEGALAHSPATGPQARAPGRRLGRGRFQSQGNDAEAAGGAGPRLIEQAVQPARNKAGPPCAPGRRTPPTSAATAAWDFPWAPANTGRARRARA